MLDPDSTMMGDNWKSDKMPYLTVLWLHTGYTPVY